jgi:zinc transporter, ZIP family
MAIGPRGKRVWHGDCQNNWLFAHEGAEPWMGRCPVPASVGLLLGAAAVGTLDKTLPHLHLLLPVEEAEGPKTTWHRAVLLVTAITLHNVPEGLAVGVAFGGVLTGLPSASMGAAIALSVGIGLQNFPEGVAVAMPLRAEGMGRFKSFWYGQLSTAVEPVAAVVGAAAVVYAAPILPYALSFAAGAMIYVIVEELIPESHAAGNVDLATVSLIGGFVVMMILDVALGYVPCRTPLTTVPKQPARSSFSIKVALPSEGKGVGSRFSAVD